MQTLGAVCRHSVVGVTTTVVVVVGAGTVVDVVLVVVVVAGTVVVVAFVVDVVGATVVGALTVLVGPPEQLSGVLSTFPPADHVLRHHSPAVFDHWYTALPEPPQPPDAPDWKVLSRYTSLPPLGNGFAVS